MAYALVLVCVYAGDQGGSRAQVAKTRQVRCAAQSRASVVPFSGCDADPVGHPQAEWVQTRLATTGASYALRDKVHLDTLTRYEVWRVLPETGACDGTPGELWRNFTILPMSGALLDTAGDDQVAVCVL